MDRITVIIPTYNEVENLSQITTELWALPFSDLHILIVDDGSPDGTGELADQIAKGNPGKIDVIHRKGKLGLGSAYLTGFKSALQNNAEAIIQMDADFSHSPSYLPGFFEHLASKDVIIGSRFVEGGSVDERWGIGRKLLSRFGNSYARVILRLPINDCTGGFRVWRRHVLERILLENIRSEGYVFQVEMAYVAYRLGFNILERPIYFEDRRIGQSKMSLRIQLEAAFRVWQILFLHRSLGNVK